MVPYVYGGTTIDLHFGRNKLAGDQKSESAWPWTLRRASRKLAAKPVRQRIFPLCYGGMYLPQFLLGPEKSGVFHLP